jgi:hypothetical protein
MLNYATPEVRESWLKLRTAAMRCALYPMGIGTVDFLLFVIARDVFFALTGLAIIGLGILAFLAGMVCLSIFTWNEIRIGNRNRIIEKIVLPLFLLCFNFPLAWAYCAMAIDLGPR